MQYTVIYELAVKNLIEKVNEHIKEGWKPVGGISVHAANKIMKGRKTIIFNCYQAMTKE